MFWPCFQNMTSPLSEIGFVKSMSEAIEGATATERPTLSTGSQAEGAGAEPLVQRQA